MTVAVTMPVVLVMIRLDFMVHMGGVKVAGSGV